MQRAFRLRRAEHLAALEERINILENENSQLRALLALPEAQRPAIGSGPTGRGKALQEGGVPMSERVRARKEARERERRAKGLPPSKPGDVSATDSDTPMGSASRDRSVDTSRRGSTLSPRAATTKPPLSAPMASTATGGGLASRSSDSQIVQQSTSLFASPADGAFNYDLNVPFDLGVGPQGPTDNHTGQNGPGPFDYSTANGSFDPSSLFKSPPGSNNFLYGMFDPPATPNSATQGLAAPPPPQAQMHSHTHGMSPLSPPPSSSATTPPNGSAASQPDLLSRLKKCCHLSDSHVVNDPGLLTYAARLCQSFPCQFSGAHPGGQAINGSDSENMLLEESWRALRATLDPGGESDGENRINTGRMAGELVVRAVHTRGGPGAGLVLCRYREGMSVKRVLIGDLVRGLGGKLE